MFTEDDEQRLAYLEQWAVDNPGLAGKSWGLLTDSNAVELQRLRERRGKFTDALQDAPTYQEVIRDFYARGDNSAVVGALMTGLHIYSSFDYPQIYEYIPYALSDMDDGQLTEVFRQQLPDEDDRTIAFKVGQVGTMRKSITRLYASPVPSNEADGWLQSARQTIVEAMGGDDERTSLNAGMDLRVLARLGVQDIFDLSELGFLGLQKIIAVPVGAVADAVGAGEAWDALESKYLDSDIQAACARLESSDRLFLKYGNGTDLIAHRTIRAVGKAMLELGNIGGLSSQYASTALYNRGGAGLTGSALLNQSRLAQEVPRLLYGLQSTGSAAAELSQRLDLGTPQWLAGALANGLVTYGVARLGVDDKIIGRMTGLNSPQTTEAVLNLGMRKYVALYGRKGLKFIQTLAQGFAGEYMEEGLEEAISTPVTNLITGDQQPGMDEYFRGIHDAGLQGGLTGMAMAGIAFSAAAPVDSRTHREMVKLMEQVDSGGTLTVGQTLRMLGYLPGEYSNESTRAEIVRQATDMLVSDRVVEMVQDGEADAALMSMADGEVDAIQQRIEGLETDYQSADVSAREAGANLTAATMEQMESLANQADPVKARTVEEATKALLKANERKAAIQRDIKKAQAEYEQKSAEADALGKQTMHDLHENATRALADESQAQADMAMAQEQQRQAAQMQEAEQQAAAVQEQDAARQAARQGYDEAREANRAAYQAYEQANGEYTLAQDQRRQYREENGTDVGSPDDTEAYNRNAAAYQQYMESNKALGEARSALEAMANPDAPPVAAETQPTEGATPGTVDGTLFASMPRTRTNLNDRTGEAAKGEVTLTTASLTCRKRWRRLLQAIPGHGTVCCHIRMTVSCRMTWSM